MIFFPNMKLFCSTYNVTMFADLLYTNSIFLEFCALILNVQMFESSTSCLHSGIWFRA